jgi:hypothetical protein
VWAAGFLGGALKITFAMFGGGDPGAAHRQEIDPVVIGGARWGSYQCGGAVREGYVQSDRAPSVGTGDQAGCLDDGVVCGRREEDAVERHRSDAGVQWPIRARSGFVRLELDKIRGSQHD